MTRRNAAIIFGGRSAEHDVSIMSARSVYESLDRKRYNPILVGIARDGKWWLQDHAKGFPVHVASTGSQIAFLPGAGGAALVHRRNEDYRIYHIDVVLPILHGPFGEDGVLQGVLETAQVPFVGCPVLASAICMDKQIAKRILRDAGLPIAQFLALTTREEVNFRFAQQTLHSPTLFVKPASLGSSIGVSKVHCESTFQAAVDLAFGYGSKVLVEAYVEGRELECAVLQDPERPTELLCSWPSEIIPNSQHAFFTYQAKSDAGGAITKAKADLDEALANRIQALSCETFKVMGCEALARVDFFMRSNGELLINEVNTLPSFTRSSMFPKMMKESGISYDVLVERLLEHAMKRYERAMASS
ncbi:D-alanine--D-alanine ligase family protein [Bradyrhizobium sp. 18]|uniref:D-alanine--D-alanine ligase family protein n=1 Tax=Bradyrhizobium sp. 18 TaxID=2782657 RepID=UPI001FF71877|nr:D-alanine--D-alanine ligase family protein [Bradyrhizobium sp. 18]MCK1504303.1 D-alanine--D-alanine ligase [Bradyrhizobium sp. 18]